MWRKRFPIDDQQVRQVKDVERSPRSIGELRQRLLEKLWTDESIVDAVLDKLKEYRYVDDEQYARDLALSRLRQRPQGRRRLEQTLSQKKLDPETIRGALDSAFEGMPEDELISAALEKFLRLRGRPQTRQDLKKIYDHLLRRGFSYSLIREKIADIGRVE